MDERSCGATQGAGHSFALSASEERRRTNPITRRTKRPRAPFPRGRPLVFAGYEIAKDGMGCRPERLCATTRDGGDASGSLISSASARRSSSRPAESADRRRIPTPKHRSMHQVTAARAREARPTRQERTTPEAPATLAEPATQAVSAIREEATALVERAVQEARRARPVATPRSIAARAPAPAKKQERQARKVGSLRRPAVANLRRSQRSVTR